jgi:RHS repeat-associated protein
MNYNKIHNCLCNYNRALALFWGLDCNNYSQLYYYHPDYIGNNEFITDISGYIYQYLYYSPFGEALLDQKANTGAFDSPYRFNAKEFDMETGLHYYGARYYSGRTSVWLSVDPLASKGPNITPYAFTHNNAIVLVDPDGNWPDIGYGFGFRTNFSGGYSISVAMGISVSGSDAMGSINMSLSAYNYGLGTTHGSTGNYSMQINMVISPALTMGSGEGRALPLNTFSNNMPTGIINNFERSGTVASNFVLNSSGRN